MHNYLVFKETLPLALFLLVKRKSAQKADTTPDPHTLPKAVSEDLIFIQVSYIDFWVLLQLKATWVPLYSDEKISQAFYTCRKRGPYI